MATNSVSFSLEGEISLDTLAKTAASLKKVLSELATEVVPGAEIRWVVDELASGGMRTTVRGCVSKGSKPSDVDKIARQYVAIGRAAGNGQALPCSDKVVDAVEELLWIAKAEGSEAIFGANGDASRIDLQSWSRMQTSAQSRAIGSVVGVIKGINGQRQPYVSVYEQGSNAAVRCFVDQEQLKWALASWGSKVFIRGHLTRDRRSRRKREIRQIITYRVADDSKSDRFEDAFGVGQWQPGDPTSVDLVRASRESS